MQTELINFTCVMTVELVVLYTKQGSPKILADEKSFRRNDRTIFNKECSSVILWAPAYI